MPVKNQKNRFVISLEREISVITWDGTSEKVSKIEKIAEVDHKTQNRLNDGKCDPRGRLWAGKNENELPNKLLQIVACRNHGSRTRNWALSARGWISIFSGQWQSHDIRYKGGNFQWFGMEHQLRKTLLQRQPLRESG